MIAVLDASVVLKWFRQEADDATAKLIQHAITDGTLMARVPDLIRYEVANVLVWKGQTGSDDAIEAIEVLERLPWHVTHPSRQLLTAAITIAARYRASMYDAIYVALALDADAPFITADEKLITKLDHPKVVHLRDFKLS